MKKIIKIFIIIFITFLSINVYANEETNKTPSVSSEEKIHDFANLLSEEEKELLKEEISRFVNKSNMDFVIVTISENPYGSTDVGENYNYNAPVDYAVDFYDYNGYGKRTNRAGIILLLDMQNREIVYDVSGDAILYYDDDRKDGIIAKVGPNLTSEKYFDALKEGILMSEDFFQKGIPTSNQDYCVNEEGYYYKCVKRVSLEIPGLLSLIITAIVVSVHLKKYRGIKLSLTANDYLKGENKKNATDKFINTFTTSVRIRSDSSGGFGGGSSGGGGSSVFSGSSGRSHSSSRGKF